MSERKKPRLVFCLGCNRPKTGTHGGLCLNCRMGMLMERHSLAGKMDKFRSHNRGE